MPATSAICVPVCWVALFSATLFASEKKTWLPNGVLLHCSMIKTDIKQGCLESRPEISMKEILEGIAIPVRLFFGAANSISRCGV